MVDRLASGRHWRRQVLQKLHLRTRNGCQCNTISVLGRDTTEGPNDVPKKSINAARLSADDHRPRGDSQALPRVADKAVNHVFRAGNGRRARRRETGDEIRHSARTGCRRDRTRNVSADQELQDFIVDGNGFGRSWTHLTIPTLRNRPHLSNSDSRLGPTTHLLCPVIISQAPEWPTVSCVLARTYCYLRVYLLHIAAPSHLLEACCSVSWVF